MSTETHARRMAAQQQYYAAARNLEAALMEEVIALTLDTFVAAHTLHVYGEYGESGFIVRAQRITNAAGETFTGYDSDGMSESEEWDDFTDEVDQLLDQLGDLDEDDWSGEQTIEMHPNEKETS